MTWIKLDDKCPRHPKIDGLSDRAFRVWVQALCYASEFLTDGVLPAAFLRAVPAKVRGELTAAGLWLVRDDQIAIHDYLTHQSGKADVERERERSRQRRAGRKPPADQWSTGGQPAKDRDQRTEVETREQTQRVEGAPRRPTPAPLTTNSAKNWGLRHSDHVAGFCTWMCLPVEDFGRFSARLGGDDEARRWADSVKASGVVPTGKPWEFWNQQFDAAHGGETRPTTGGFSKADWDAHKPGGAIDKKLGLA